MCLLDPSLDEERDTTDAETDSEATLAEESWCPPIPDTPDDPTENEITGATNKLETMMNGSQPQAIFFRPTPSWLSPGRSTCFIACCKMGLID